MRLSNRGIVAVMVGLLSVTALADWPKYRGPNNDGISTEKMLATWPAGGPKVLWKNKVGAGIGSFAIKGSAAYFLAQVGDNESCFAVDVKSGKQLWTTSLGGTFTGRNSGQGGTGPCSTPVVEGDRIYTYGSLLKLFCLNVADGKVVWQHDIQSEFNGQGQSSSAIQKWGAASSPVVEGDLVIVQGGGSGQTFIAFKKTTGEVAWKKETEVLTHSTPTPATIAGVRQIIFLMQSGLVSLDVKSGETLWKQPYQSATAIAASPVVLDDLVYCSIGYGVGAGVFQVSKDGDKFAVKQVWRTRGKAMNMWSTPVIKDGYVYEIHGTGGDKNAPLQCIELKTGNQMWSGPVVGQGQTLLVDGKLIIQSATGKLLLVDPNPKEYKEISSAQPLSGQAWGVPAFSDGVLLYRTNTEACALDLSAQ